MSDHLLEVIEENLFEAPPNERQRYSVIIFEALWAELASEKWRRGHGRLHPRFISYRQRRAEFQPPSASSSITTDDPWTWPDASETLDPVDWDRVHVLRIAVLAAAGPEAIADLGRTPKVAELCREWLERVERHPPSDSKSVPEMARQASDSLKFYLQAVAYEDSLDHFRQAVEELLPSTGAPRYLRQSDEDGLRQRFGELNEFDSLLSVASLQNSVSKLRRIEFNDFSDFRLIINH